MAFEKIKSKLLIILGTLIFAIIVLLSYVHFKAVKHSLIHEVREKQLKTIVKASQNAFQVILEKAVETSELLAADAVLLSWFSANEPEGESKVLALNRLNDIHKRFHYQTVFAVSSQSHHYWRENNDMLDVVSADDPDDSWFFKTLDKGVKTSFNFDHNRELQQTILFINVLMGAPSDPVGIAGVGIDPSSLIDEFDDLKPTANSRLWLIDTDGKIHLSENQAEINHRIDSLLTYSLVEKLLIKRSEAVFHDTFVNDQLVEVAFADVGETGYKIVLIVPTEELLGVLEVIKKNTVWLALLALVLTVVVISILAGHLTKPLYRLTQLTKSYAKGEFKQHIDKKLLVRGDEIGNLANAFEIMQQQLEQVIQRLSQTNAALHLEKNQLKETNEKLEKALIKASESDRLAKAFLANISHEIRTPMNSIMGFAQLLELGDLDPADQMYYAGEVVKSGNDLVDMISSIVNISKVEAEFIKPLKQSVNIKATLEELAEAHKAAAQKAGLQLLCTLPDESEKDMVITDLAMLKQIFNSLLSNAFKFTVSGTVEVGYVYKNNCIEFFVKDTGIGIEKRNRDAIFDPFVQLVHPNLEVTGGAGLGLTLAKRLVTCLGGQISVSSSPGKGSVFSFTVEKSPQNTSQPTMVFI